MFTKIVQVKAASSVSTCHYTATGHFMKIK